MRRNPMHRNPIAAGVAAGLTAVLCACSSGGSAVPRPTASSTPPAVQRTVAVGATVHAGGPAGTHVMPGGGSMSGMSMPGGSMSGMSMPGTSTSPPAPSVVPNGSGSHVVAAPDVDGCDRAYGLVSQCVPARAPGGGPVTCAVLRAYHYLPLLVTEDRLGLVSHGGATVRITGGKRYITGCSS